jgi:hypothetical protein
MTLSRSLAALALSAFILPAVGARAFEGTSKKTGHALIDKDKDGSKKLKRSSKEFEGTSKKTRKAKSSALIDKDKDGSK